MSMKMQEVTGFLVKNTESYILLAEVENGRAITGVKGSIDDVGVLLSSLFNDLLESGVTIDELQYILEAIRMEFKVRS